MRSIRCSALPSGFRCPESIRGAVEICGFAESSADGLATHEYARQLVAGEHTEAPEDLARIYEADPDEVRMLCAQLLKLWHKIKIEEGTARAEISLGGTFTSAGGPFRLTGHVDVETMTPARIYVNDWKTGRVDRSYYHQLAGYSALELDAHPEIDEVVASVSWVRTGEIEAYTFMREKARAWLDRLAAEVVDPSGRFVTGGHCDYCPRAHDCPPRSAMAVAHLRDFMAAGGDEQIAATVKSISPERLLWLVNAAKSVGKAAETVRDEAKKRVEAEGGTIRVSDTAELALEERKVPKILPGVAWPILQKRLTGEQMEEVVKVGMGALQDAVGKAAPHGKKGEARAEIRQALASAGALKETTQKILVDRRPK